MKQVTAACMGALSLASAIAQSPSSLDRVGAMQCVVVIAPGWTAEHGSMTTFERNAPDGLWRQRTPVIPVVLGRNGLGWGRGVATVSASDGPEKKEGDNKSPAGVFALSKVFGYAQTATTRMPYLQATADLICVDDPRSRYYNRMFESSSIARRDWRSGEQMRRKDVRYKWGVVVDHNGSRNGEKPAAGAGSCVFLHVWLTPQTPTTGCTAMAERNIVDLIHWLDPTRKPVLVQLPEAIYRRYQAEWRLPRLD